jgi:hypothetical protein
VADGDEEPQDLAQTGRALAQALARAQERGPEDHNEAIKALVGNLSGKNAGALLAALPPETVAALTPDVLRAFIAGLSNEQLELF